MVAGAAHHRRRSRARARSGLNTGMTRRPRLGTNRPMATSSQPFDAAIIGGGVIGCATALHLAQGGMRVVVFERGGLCRQASGRNAGTLTMLYTRASLIPYALRGREMWRDAKVWLGRDAGFHPRHGMELAFLGAGGRGNGRPAPAARRGRCPHRDDRPATGRARSSRRCRLTSSGPPIASSTVMPSPTASASFSTPR